MNTDPSDAATRSRADLVDAARQTWVARLMDTTRRNNLLYFRDLKTGTLDLSGSEEGALARLLDGEEVALSRLVPPSSDPAAGPKLQEIARRAQSNLEEKGLQTLFLAYGMATWPVEDDGRPPEAAVALLPLSTKAKARSLESTTIQATGHPQVNFALLHALSETFGLELSEEDILADEADGAVDAKAILAAVAASTRGLSGFAIKPRAVIGNFSFQKLAMVRDLREMGEALVQDDMVAALAGDQAARRSFGGKGVAIEPRQLDSVPAASEYMVLDADSSQQSVIHSVARGMDGVIQGPPGCGKSQTIANTIAMLVANGQRVLFVAEKRAALEAVFKRLDEKGLGHLALDLHGAALSQKGVMQKVSLALDQIRRSGDPNEAEALAKFEDRRARAVAHESLMHTPTAPSGLTPFLLQARLLETARLAPSKTRWREADLQKLDAATVEDLLKTATGYATLVARTDPSPWVNADLPDGGSVLTALDAARSLAEQSVPHLTKSLEELARKTSFSVPRTLKEAEEAASLVSDANRVVEAWSASVFGHNGLASALSPAGRGAVGRLWAAVSDAGYRSALRLMRELSGDKSTTPGEALEGARLADQVRGRWEELSDGASAPTKTELDSDTAVQIHKVAADLAVLLRSVPEASALDITALRDTARALADDEETAYKIPKVREIEAGIKSAGAGQILLEIREPKNSPDKWTALFRHAYYASCYDGVRVANPALAAFSGEAHSTVVDEFRELDRHRLAIAAARVRRRHAEHAVEVMNQHPEQTDLVRSEAAKRTRHIPLRRLVSRSADVLTAVCPCWMSSPLNVSQLLPADRKYFDVVVFDEASQVLPEDAVSSIIRGERLVVAGDQHQLPPTMFFADGAGEEDEESPTAGYESLLDSLSAFVDHWQLDWHYRSRDERLIAFSNRHIYGDRLTTFPGIGGPAVVSHFLVDSVPRDGEEESSTAEVQKVVELVVAHADEQTRLPADSRQTLGVIAMGIKHARRVEAALDRALAQRPDLDEFFDPARQERFFVKNLEQVQGDERDVVILTIGYGKDRNGRLPYRFGPLLQQGGERRLNVAVSRARRRMTVVSSFGHADMDPSRSDKKGVELLRLYLQFAASQGDDLGDAGGTEVGMNAFEADVYDALSARGVGLVPQYGVSGYRLDFAAQHPKRPGEFVLAIECDGASYHSAATARDRDRLRQQQLESIGWRFHRIWSTDWFLHREEQIERARAAWEEAVRRADGSRRLADEGRAAIGGLFGDPPTGAVEEAAEGPVADGRVRGPRPPVPGYGQTDAFDLDDLVRMARWVQSDGLMRTDDEIVGELVDALGFQRRTKKFEGRALEAIAWLRRNGGRWPRA